MFERLINISDSIEFNPNDDARLELESVDGDFILSSSFLLKYNN